MLPKDEPTTTAWNIVLTVLGGAAICALLIYVLPGGAAVIRPPSAPTATAERAKPTITPIVSSGGDASSTTSGGRLPPCSTVQDTRTACEQDQAEIAPAAAQETPTAEPTSTPAPAYESACWTIPGERPCWLSADQPWEPPASIPETPIVLVPAPPLVFSDSPCAAWHPPLALPEGCGDE